MSAMDVNKYTMHGANIKNLPSGLISTSLSLMGAIRTSLDLSGKDSIEIPW